MRRRMLLGAPFMDMTRQAVNACNLQLNALGQNRVTYSASRTLNQAILALKATMNTIGNSSQTGTVVADSQGTVKKYIPYTYWTNGFDQYDPSTMPGHQIFASALLFDSDMTPAQVGTAIANNVARWKLQAASTAFVFEGHIAILRCSANGAAAWLTGIELIQEQK